MVSGVVDEGLMAACSGMHRREEPEANATHGRTTFDLRRPSSIKVPTMQTPDSLAFSCEGVTWSVMDVLGFLWRVIRSVSTPPVPGKYLKCLRSNGIF